ncbi:MAG TPA: hypothetical protein DCM28_01195 [Phycisphaerales bacterium]|nr:hypothetical protein [Phycisphaerales bacterium]HCD31464.1 hypothetical protein [Phycisphaerales bacterium]
MMGSRFFIVRLNCKTVVFCQGKKAQCKDWISLTIRIGDSAYSQSSLRSDLGWADINFNKF